MATRLAKAGVMCIIDAGHRILEKFSDFCTSAGVFRA
jgi:hypothetical protein